MSAIINSNNDHVNYNLKGSDLTKINQEKDLGIIICNYLIPEKHIFEIVETVNKLTGFMGGAFDYKSGKSYTHAF